MQETALVALFTGGSTAMASVMTAVCAIVNERLRARRQFTQELQARAMDQDESRKRTLRQSFQDTQAAVLHLGVTVRISLNIRTDGYARLDGTDLPEQLRQVREDYLAALVATETLWALAEGTTARTAIDELRFAVTTAFDHARSAASPIADPAGIDKDLLTHLRAVGEAFFGEPSPPDPARTS